MTTSQTINVSYRLPEAIDSKVEYFVVNSDYDYNEDNIHYIDTCAFLTKGNCRYYISYDNNYLQNCGHALYNHDNTILCGNYSRFIDMLFNPYMIYITNKEMNTIEVSSAGNKIDIDDIMDKQRYNRIKAMYHVSFYRENLDNLFTPYEKVIILSRRYPYISNEYFNKFYHKIYNELSLKNINISEFIVENKLMPLDNMLRHYKLMSDLILAANNAKIKSLFIRYLGYITEIIKRICSKMITVNMALDEVIKLYDSCTLYMSVQFKNEILNFIVSKLLECVKKDTKINFFKRTLKAEYIKLQIDKYGNTTGIELNAIIDACKQCQDMYLNYNK
jgi:hypothetical protein